MGHADPQHWPAERAAQMASAVVANVEKVLVGKHRQVETALAALIAEGHLLIEDVPGLGKTMLARALASSIGLEFKRIQFTSDLMPADVLGGPVYNPKDGSFAMRPGPVFANVVLADEINRANPRAQSALLECMEERQATLDGTSLRMPDPFVVLATQNPIDMAGTYPLPEAQLDRFLIRLSLGYPAPEVEQGLIATQQFQHPIAALRPVCRPDDFRALVASAKHTFISTEIAAYITTIVSATRQHAAVRFGASPRGTLALARMARSLSCVRGLEQVDPSIVRELAVPVLSHRIVVKTHGGSRAQTAEAIVQEILQATRTPR
jgi:MoxR-like ATPase